MTPETYPFVVKPLPYEYDALVPLLDEETMRIHHDRHYKNYVDNLNGILSDYPEWQKSSLTELLTHLDKLPIAIRTGIRNNGGGVLIHELYFDSLHAGGEMSPEGELARAIERDFGSEKLWKAQMRQACISQFGSGWAWMLSDAEGRLSIVQTSNQDVPDLKLYTPILAIDVWEHAYYLQYQNRRADYVDGVLDVIHWRKVEKRYNKREK